MALSALKTACLSMLFRMPKTLSAVSRKIAASALVVGLGSAGAHASYFDTTAGGGSVRVHYNATATPASCNAIVLGVGTAMTSEGYDKLSAQLISYGYVVAIIDHQPGNLTKTDAGKYANVANAVKQNMVSWMSGKTKCTNVARWVMGGHSAGGQAAHNAVVKDSHLADAMFNIDPYDISGAGLVSLPTLNWGFTNTTCFVEVEKAAKAAYQKSTGQRAFVKVGKKYSWGPCGYSPAYFHCSFCDSHCPACTNCATTPDHFFVDVGRSVNKFMKAVTSGNWSKSALSFTSTTPVTLYVDGDQP